MEWLLVPIVVVGLCVLISWFTYWVFNRNQWESDFLVVETIVSIVTGVVIILMAPCVYYDGWDESNRWSAYYDNVISPHIIDSGDDYVVVDSMQSGVWQAGELNVSEYNAYIMSNRKWDEVPFIGLMVYRCPDRLKYARAQDSVG